MTTSIDVGFDAVGLNTAYPFHFVMDAQDHVIQVGRSMEKLLPELKQTTSMCDLIHVTSPVGPMTHSHLSKHPGRLIILSLPTQDNLTIRAQAIPGNNGSLIVIGSPWFTEMSQVGACGLSLADFAAHESVTDLLLLVQTQTSSLSDATNMADALGAACAPPPAGSPRSSRCAAAARIRRRRCARQGRRHWRACAAIAAAARPA